jgi:hypothetical protein
LEGINNKIKTLTKRSYGFHDENFFILRLLSLHHASPLPGRSCARWMGYFTRLRRVT